MATQVTVSMHTFSGIIYVFLRTPTHTFVALYRSRWDRVRACYVPNGPSMMVEMYDRYPDGLDRWIGYAEGSDRARMNACFEVVCANHTDKFERLDGSYSRPGTHRVGYYLSMYQGLSEQALTEGRDEWTSWEKIRTLDVARWGNYSLERELAGRARRDAWLRSREASIATAA
jgi:hypothetical protein